MAISNIPIDELNGFSKRLAILAREHGLGNPEKLAEALYENAECEVIIRPRERKNSEGKKIKSETKEKNAIKRAIQYHYEEEDAYKIQSTYMYAYSILFDCSLDYLYGKSDIRTSDIVVRDICEKTGLSEKAVINLMEFRKSNEYIDDDELKYSDWWSELLGGEDFKKIPDVWFVYADIILQLKVLKSPPKSKWSDEDMVKKYYDLFPGLGNIVPMEEILSPDEETKKHERVKEKEREYQKKEETRLGAFYEMLSCVERILNKYTEKYVDKQYPDYIDKQNQAEYDSLKKFSEYLYSLKDKMENTDFNG